MLTPIEIKFSAQSILNTLKHCQLEQDQFDDMNKLDIMEPTGNFFYDPWQLKESFRTPELIALFDQLPPVGQTKIVSIPPGTAYQAHADIEDRYHITLQGKHSYLIDLEHNEMHSTDVNDQCYLMDTTSVHTAANFGDCDRIQLVIRLLLNRNRLNTPVRISIQPKLLDQPHNQRLWMDQHILTWLNQANKRGIMAHYNPMGEDTHWCFDLEQECVTEFEQRVRELPFECVVACDSVAQLPQTSTRVA